MHVHWIKKWPASGFWESDEARFEKNLDSEVDWERIFSRFAGSEAEQFLQKVGDSTVVDTNSERMSARGVYIKVFPLGKDKCMQEYN